MAHSSPGTTRTPRSRALEIGTDPKGFGGTLDYDTQGGHPTGPGMPSGTYTDNAEGAHPTPAAKPAAPKTPFS